MALWKFSNKNKYGNWRYRIIVLPDDKPFSHGPGFGSSVGASRFKYTYEHPVLSPSIFKSPTNGKTYIIPTWIEVLPETTLNDIEWIKPKPKVVKSKDTPISTSEYKFESKSKPGDFYIVKVIDNKIKCNCSGFWRCRDKNIGCVHCQKVRSGV
jgi:hypothetical protein